MAYRTSVAGFPRIGKKRELKFALEKYFRNEISVEELEQTGRQMREYGWKRQKEAGIDFIPSNDFSFYDNLLDAAFLFNIVPERYSALDLSGIDKYFAAARGYQGPAGDVRALPMKKWFNTNYHYIVPEFSDSTKPALSSDNKLLAEFEEAKSLGIRTLPTIAGVYTLLSLSTFAGEKKAGNFASDLVAAYASLAAYAAGAGAEWISFAEPALVFDMDENDRSFFRSLYKSLLEEIRRKSPIKVLLQTFFGDIRDCYDDVASLGFDGIGLDFVEGSRSLSLVERGFPKDTVLFAGIVNGKNIWRSDYGVKASLVEKIAASLSSEKIVLSTSCSLLHVPYTTSGEDSIAADVKKYFAFAEEKLSELSEIACGVGEKSGAFESNSMLFASERVFKCPDVQNAISSLTAGDFVRKPDFFERERIQKGVFNLPAYPTTTIGSFPQTVDVRANRALYRNGKMTKAAYDSFIEGKIRECVEFQEGIGLDVLVHGEFERNDMVEYFGSQLYGYIFTKNAWVQSYGSRCVKPPIIWSDICRRSPMTVKWSVFAQKQTKKPVKGMLTGPVTILNWSFPREDSPLREQALQLALAIRDEVLDLEKNGIRIIQIDEAALREKLPLRKSDWRTGYLDWAVPAFRLVHAKVRPETQIHTHMCYSEFGDIIKDIDDMDADVITFEASRGDLKILDDLKNADFKTEVGPGVYDIHSARVPSVEEIVAALKKMSGKIPVGKLWVNPDCGLKTRGERETVESLKNLVAAAKILRES